MMTMAAPSVWRYLGTKPTQSFSPVPANTSATSSNAVLRRRPRKSANLRQRLISQFHLLGTVAEIVEQRHAVGLRPYPDHSSFREGLVVPLERLFSIERDGEMIVTEIDSQRVPLARCDLHRRSLLLGAFALYRLVNEHIVFAHAGWR